MPPFGFGTVRPAMALILVISIPRVVVITTVRKYNTGSTLGYQLPLRYHV
jgi:hypothetical protein